MKASQFVGPFQDDVNEWDVKLSMVSKIIKNILQVQQMCLSLNDIFQGEKIRHYMKPEYEKFRTVVTGESLATSEFLITIFFNRIPKNLIKHAIEGNCYRSNSF